MISVPGLVYTMSDSLSTLARKLLSRVQALWVKPDVLPASPTTLIDRNKPVLYVLEVGGVADYTALRIVCSEQGLPPPRQTLVYGDARERSSVDVLRRRRGFIFRRHRHVISARLARLVEAGMRADAGELQIVPVAVYWGRAPEKESSLWGLWFSENWQIAGRSRKLLTTILHGRHTLVSISEPLSFATLKKTSDSTATLQRKLSRILRVHFRKRRIATLGPDQSHKRMLVDSVLADASVRQAILAESSGQPSHRARRKAEHYAFEIAADVSYPTVRVLHRLLTRLWNQLYDGVELSGMDRLKAIADGNELIYVPCHRSHIDYLLLSYILYVQGYSLPHIAAGINLDLPVVGSLLRRGGAFFLRRSFSGKPLYAAVFNAYLKAILQRGHALEYFVEGGRSRTGRLLPPKGGMLAMTVQAYLRKPETPVVFVPVYFGYERLLEGRAFTSELAGGKKQQESILGLIKSLRTLRQEYGRVYVNIGEPITLNSVLDRNQPDWRQLPASSDRPTWLKPVVNDLGVSIMRHINEAASVTPISLLATALLATPNDCISHTELILQLNLYQQLLSDAHSDTLVEVADINGAQLIEHGCNLGFIETVQDKLGPIIQIRGGQAAPLTYFRNNVLHLLTLPALIAAAFTNRRSYDDTNIKDLITFSFPFLQGELFLPTTLSGSGIDQSLEALAGAALIKLQNGQWHRAAAGTVQAVTLQRLAQVVTPALERDYLCVTLLVQSQQNPIAREELMQRCQLSAERLAKTHAKDAGELFDKHLHQAFITRLIEQEFVTETNNKLSATDKLKAIDVDVVALITEQTRQSIISVAIAATKAAQDGADTD